MRNKFFLFSTFILIFTLVFFNTSPVFSQVQETQPPEREYVIGIGDQLDIQVWRSQEFSRKVIVRSDGKITIPFLGDIKAVNLKVSMVQKDLERRLQKYLKDPQLSITVGSSGQIRAVFSGAISQEIQLPRGTTLSQVLRQLFPTLQQLQPPPNLAEIKVIGVEEEFLINGSTLLAGNAPQANIRLEWGDEIFIPPQVIPETALDARPDITTLTPKRTLLKRAILTPQEFDDILQKFPYAQEQLDSLATLSDDQTYSINLEALSEAQRQALGDEVLAELEKYAIIEPGIEQKFTDITLAGIAINLAYEEAVEAFLAIPNPDPNQLPIIQSFREGELVKKGETETEDIFLDEILERENAVILRKGQIFQTCQLPTPLTNAKLSGIMDLGNTRKVFFSNLETSKSKRLMKRGGFKQGDEIENGVVLAAISDQWVLVENGQDIQLMLLHDSLNRAASQTLLASLTGIPEQPAQFPGTETEQAPQTPADIIKRNLPAPLRALDAFSKLFLATPLF